MNEQFSNIDFDRHSLVEQQRRGTPVLKHLMIMLGSIVGITTPLTEIVLAVGFIILVVSAK